MINVRRKLDARGQNNAFVGEPVLGHAYFIMHRVIPDLNEFGGSDAQNAPAGQMEILQISSTSVDKSSF
jgi:hypothetical protein